MTLASIQRLLRLTVQALLHKPVVGSKRLAQAVLVLHDSAHHRLVRPVYRGRLLRKLFGFVLYAVNETQALCLPPVVLLTTESL